MTLPMVTSPSSIRFAVKAAVKKLDAVRCRAQPECPLGRCARSGRRWLSRPMFRDASVCADRAFASDAAGRQPILAQGAGEQLVVLERVTLQPCCLELLARRRARQRKVSQPPTARAGGDRSAGRLHQRSYCAKPFTDADIAPLSGAPARAVALSERCLRTMKGR
jgi:hypothetical protein